MDTKNIRTINTQLPGHHFFGFHDLVAFNQNNDKILGLQTDIINRPPLPGEKISLGFADTQSGAFKVLGKTNAFNYPQGARQQWLTDDMFIVNNQIGNSWGAEVYDTHSGKVTEVYNSTCHCRTKDNKWAFGIDYQRLHRLGGYGYIGIEDESKHEATPANQGIWKLDLQTKEKKLLISIKEVANHQQSTSSSGTFHHYLTHLVLNPNDSRIAFLHRFFLPDGGIRTRLMTIGSDGSNLRCLAVGFLSHFDWKDNSTLFIWGRIGGGIDQLRSNPLLSNPLISPLIRVAKGIVRKTLNKVSTQLSMSFNLVKDSDDAPTEPAAEGVLTEDGHPMFNPVNRDYIITDNYPDKNKERTLMLYNFSTNSRIDVGVYRMLDSQPDTSKFSEYSKGVDPQILKLMSPEIFSFTRSGLHCDLHPRWNADGTMVAFDSIHEGSRQLYWMDVNTLLK